MHSARKHLVSRNLLILSLCFMTLSAPGAGLAPFPQALRDVGTDLRLMCVAAHPDDEDGAALALYRMKYGIRTVAVVATRGEGGQNEIGPELYEELGVIRTAETMAAAALQGAELRFLNLPDLGYSKSSEEAFAQWGKEETVRRIVRVIREERPDVIICHHGTQKDHGHHQAVGIALQEAFDAAADPARFPEQRAEGLQPWQVSRLYLRDWSNPPKPESVRIDIGQLDPDRRLTYAQIAAEALKQHRSQGMALFAETRLSGHPKVFYTLVSEAPQSTVGRARMPAPGGALFAGLMDRVSARDRALSATDYGREGLKRTVLRRTAAARKVRDASSDAWRRWERLNHAAVAITDLSLTAEPGDRLCVPGQSLFVAAEFRDAGEREPLGPVTFALRPALWFAASADEPQSVPLAPEGWAAAALSAAVPAAAPLTIPPAAYLFDAHFMQPQMTVTATVDCGGVPLELEAPVRIDVAPPITVEFTDSNYLVRHGVDKSAPFAVRLTNHAPQPVRGTLVLSVSPSFQLAARRIPVEFTYVAGRDAGAPSAEGEQRIVPITAAITPEGAPPGDYHLAAMMEGSPQVAGAVARVVDVALPENVRAGVIQSYDDTFVRTLERLHVPHETLSWRDLTPNRLAAFTCVIVDLRAYLVRPDLTANNQALLEYAAGGGTVLVMYQKTHEWKASFAPYPIQLSANRVTREDAPIHVLVPGHPVFTTPNIITQSDWDGWRQERGLYFPNAWDSAYTPLIQCADPGEDLPPGSCLIAKYGRGTYLYTALGWYRQLRDLHPGALRVFANMLAL